MRDVTVFLNNYRECVRHIWNTYFFNGEENPSAYTDDLLDQFEEIDKLIFSTLVLGKFSKLSYCEYFKKEPLHFLLVDPSSESVPIMINRPSSDGNKYWDESVNRIGKVEARLHFIECFDWNSYGHADLKYYKVRIASFPKHSFLEGRDALLEVQYARVFFDEDKG